MIPTNQAGSTAYKSMLFQIYITITTEISMPCHAPTKYKQKLIKTYIFIRSFILFLALQEKLNAFTYQYFLDQQESRFTVKSIAVITGGGISVNLICRWCVSTRHRMTCFASLAGSNKTLQLKYYGIWLVQSNILINQLYLINISLVVYTNIAQPKGKTLSEVFIIQATFIVQELFCRHIAIVKSI